MQNKSKLQEYQRFIQIIEKMMLIAGLWPVAKPSLFYRAIPFVNIFVYITITLFILNFMQLHVSDMNLMMKGMSTGASYLTTMLKIICITFNRKGMMELHETLGQIFNELLNNAKLQHLLSQQVTNIHKISSVLVYFIWLSILAYIVTPILFVINQLIHHIEPIEYILAMPIAYPWNITGGSFLYMCTYVIESYSYCLILFVTCGIDALFPFYIFQMMGQFQAISHRLTNLTSQDDYNEAIQECVVKHLALMRCRDILQVIYGPIILWMLVTSAIILCALIFQMFKLESISVEHIGVFICYTTTKLLQAFLYGWAGSILTSESEAFAESIYASDWPDIGQKSFITSILIMLSQKPLVLTACRISILSVDIFTRILNTTISYFFLLQTMEDKQN